MVVVVVVVAGSTMSYLVCLEMVEVSTSTFTKHGLGPQRYGNRRAENMDVIKYAEKL